MAQSICRTEKVQLRQERLARSTHVSKLVSSFEALASRPRHDYTAAAGMAPYLALPDAEAMIRHRRSVQEIKDELVGKASSTSSEASVVNVTQQKLPRAKLLHDATPRKPVDVQSLTATDAKAAVPVKLVEPARTPSLTTAAAGARGSAPILQPSRGKDFVLQRDDLGRFGFSILTTMTPDMERVHVVFQAADSIARLPVGLLVSANGLLVKNMTASELQYIFDQSTESVRLRIQQLSFPLDVLQEMVADQTSPVTYQDLVDYRLQRRAHPAKRWAKRKLTGVARALSRVREAIAYWR
ncbi:Hypp4619 [Branchiostoma lanceolatum]|uniref:Hypp4619 protein n=1 Tax=Branchiostoma lanceolatum TaxID=7740 RepID=A0A8K0AAU9_BRALA|nr:Hypp4619 [Branchiostoma lanceolatum]